MRRVEIKNDWESYAYFVDGQNVNPKEIHKVYDENGNAYEVEPKEEMGSYSDCGNRYLVPRIVLTVEHVFGKTILRPSSVFFID